MPIPFKATVFSHENKNPWLTCPWVKKSVWGHVRVVCIDRHTAFINYGSPVQWEKTWVYIFIYLVSQLLNLESVSVFGSIHRPCSAEYSPSPLEGTRDKVWWGRHNPELDKTPFVHPCVSWWASLGEDQMGFAKKIKIRWDLCLCQGWWPEMLRIKVWHQ